MDVNYGAFRVKSSQHKTFYLRNWMKLSTDVVLGKILFYTNFQDQTL